MAGSASVGFSGRPRGMSLTGFLASLIISELVKSFFDLSPLLRRLPRGEVDHSVTHLAVARP